MSILDDLEIYQTDVLNENIRDTDGNNIGQNLSDGEAQDIGDGDNDGENKDDGDGVPKKVELKKRSVRRNLNVNLNVDMLMGKRGVHTIENYFKDIKYQGRGNERNDLNNIMKRLEHWSHRLYPKYSFDDNIASIETLGKKKVLQVHMTKYRRNMLVDQTDLIRGDENGDSDTEQPLEYFDEIDELIDKQIQISKVDRTNNTTVQSNTSRDLEFNNLLDRSIPGPSTSSASILAEPLNTSVASTSQPVPSTSNTLSAEQLAKIHENRLRALQIRKEKEKARLEAENLL